MPELQRNAADYILLLLVLEQQQNNHVLQKESGEEMKRCLACNTLFSSSFVDCPTCRLSPVLVDGFYAYAPDLALEGGGFKATYFANLARLEAGYFWFRVRNNLIIWALGRYCNKFESFLEIGCGTGFVISGIANAFPNAKLYGSEIFSAGLAFAAAREPAVNFMQMDARNIPFVDEFDAIGAFDVLEHIEEDRDVLVQMRGALKPDGVMLLTVPQHPWLWSPTDDHACHVRRYSAKELHEKVASAGFEILRSTSFVSSLLPAMVLSRMVSGRASVEEDGSASEFKISPRLNSVLEKILRAEIATIRSGLNLPFGGSRLIVARKKLP